MKWPHSHAACRKLGSLVETSKHRGDELSTGVPRAAVGYIVDAQIMRRIIGESQASIFILTVAFGFIFRALAGMIFGWNTRSLDTPFDEFVMWSTGAHQDRS